MIEDYEIRGLPDPSLAPSFPSLPSFHLRGARARRLMLADLHSSLCYYSPSRSPAARVVDAGGGCYAVDKVSVCLCAAAPPACLPRWRG